MLAPAIARRIAISFVLSFAALVVLHNLLA